MREQFEQYVFVQLMQGLADRLSVRSGASTNLAMWACTEGFERIGIELDPYDEDDSSSRNSPLVSFAHHWDNPRNRQISSVAWKEFIEVLARRSEELRTRTKSQLQKNIAALAKEVGFDVVETAILSLAVRLSCYEPLRSLCHAIMDWGRINPIQLIACFLNCSQSEISTRLKTTGRLARTGLVRLSGDDCFESDEALGLPDAIQRALLPPNAGINDIRAAIFGVPCKAQLGWSDYDHLAEDRGFVADLLQGAVREQARGINILLYGAPGTGKTEFCKMIATRLKLNLYSIGEVNEEGQVPERSERIAAMRLSDHLLSHNKQAALLFDEMEDLLDGEFGDYADISKVFINRLLENNAVPTFWTCNDIDGFDPALLRRMTIAIEVRSPPKAVRARIWKKVLHKHNVTLPKDAIATLAQTYEGPPSMISNAARSVSLAGGGNERIRYSVNKMARVSQGSITIHPEAGKNTPFNLSLLNADQDFSQLTSCIVDQKIARNFSFCLYGPAGTGKSAYIRYLAKAMNIEVIQKRTSDLASKWVGDTEQNIAEAFQEAQDREAFLIFDEADSLLRDRRGADHSWEVTQVNEMLTWMESHPLPFACTTNLMNHLDPASLRRFVFKVKCDYLSALQSALAFEHFFNLKPPTAIKNLTALAPGDYAVVRRKASILGQLSNPGCLLTMLREECEAKPDVPKPIGFRVIK